MNRTALMQQLITDEALKLKPYKCTANKLTIGVGRNLDDRGITKEEAMYLLNNDIDLVCDQLDKYIPWWRDLSDVRQQVLANMAFNLGIKGLLGFKNTLAKIKAGDYAGAADNMLASLWARQVGNRAKRLAELMKKG